MIEIKNPDFAKQPEAAGRKRSDISVPQPMPPIEMVLKKGRSGVPIYGIYCWAIDYGDYRDAIKGIGFKNMRTAAVNDDNFKMIAEDGIPTFVTLGSARSAFASDEEFVEGNIQKYLNFLRRYGPNGSFFKDYPEVPYHPIEAIELYNEPNFQYMVPNSTPIAEKIRLYSMLQIAAYPRIKAEFPTVTVIGFGAGGASAADIGFVRGCLDHDKRMYDTMDVFSTHPYADNSPFAYANWLRFSVTSCYNELQKALASGGKENLPVWYTELGWMIRPDCGGHFNTCQSGYNQEEQAAFTVQMYTLGLRLGIERITNMYIMDTDNCNPGFVDRDTGKWRPIAYATKTMIDLLPDPRLVGAILDGENNAYAYRIESKPDGEEVIIAFSAVERQPITIPWDSDRALLTDMYGHDEPVAVEGGSLTFEGGAYPVYIRHIHQ